MKKAVSVLFHPESLIGVGDFGGGICAGGFHIMLPAHVVLVDHHRVAERQANATVVTSWTKFAVWGLGQLNVIVRHEAPSCCWVGGLVFELEGH